MKFSTILATAASLALTQARTVRFFTESNNTKVNNKGLYSAHEGAGINYLFLDGEPQNFTITDAGEIYYPIQTGDGKSYPQTLSIVNSPGSFPSLQVSVTGDDVYWLIENDYLSANGSSNFWAAKNTSDPYNYSNYAYNIGLFLNGTTNPTKYVDATPVKIKAEIQD